MSRRFVLQPLAWYRRKKNFISQSHLAFPAQPLLRNPVSFIFDYPFLPLHLGKDRGRKQDQFFNTVDKIHSGLYEIVLELQHDCKAVDRCLQTQVESRCSEELSPSYCGYCYTRDQFIHLWKKKEGSKD